MNKKNKKFILNSSIVLLILFGSTMGIGYGIGNAIKKDDDYIKYFIGGKEYVIENSNTTYNNNNEVGAKNILKQYYSAALFGNSNFGGTNKEVGGNKYDYIFKSKNGGKWNVAPIISKDLSDEQEITGDALQELKRKFITMRFSNDTISSSVHNYLLTNEELKDNDELFEIATLLENKGWHDLNYFKLYSAKGTGNNDSGIQIINQILGILENDINYNNKILKDMYIYSYLWQDSSSTVYDFNLTKELVYSKPSLVSTMKIDTVKAKGNSAFENLKTASKTQYKKEVWNKNFIDLKDSLIDVRTEEDQIKKDANTVGLKGFSGITLGSTEEGVASDWTNISNTWDKENANADNQSKTKTGTYVNKNIMFGDDINLYIANPNAGGANGVGALIIDIESDPGDNTGWDKLTGTANIYSYSQLYPYTFAKQIEEGVLGPSTYSLFANVDNSTGNEIFTKATEDTINPEYIFDRWFNNVDGNNEEEAALGEIAITQEIINNNSSIEEKAFSFWKDKGFYIDLSGTFSTNYASFIPDAILKD